MFKSVKEITFLSFFILKETCQSCFFTLANAKGVKSDECKTLCSLFSRAVDQHASDLKLLKQLCEKAQSSFPAQMMAWEQMKRVQFETVDYLEKRKPPSDEEWLDDFLGE